MRKPLGMWCRRCVWWPVSLYPVAHVIMKGCNLAGTDGHRRFGVLVGSDAGHKLADDAEALAKGYGIALAFYVEFTGHRVGVAGFFCGKFCHVLLASGPSWELRESLLCVGHSTGYGLRVNPLFASFSKLFSGPVGTGFANQKACQYKSRGRAVIVSTLPAVPLAWA